MQQPDPGQFAHGALYGVPLGEFPRPRRDLPNKIGDRQERRMPMEDVHQDDALVPDVLLRSGWLIASPFRLILHGKGHLSCAGPGAVPAVPRPFLSCRPEG